MGPGCSAIAYSWCTRPGPGAGSPFRNGNTFLYNRDQVTSLNDRDLNFRQSYDIDLIKLDHQAVVSTTKIADDVPVAPSNVGKASMPDYKKLRDSAVTKLSGGTTAFAGQADDPFFLDLRVFDLLYGGDLSEVGRDTLKGYNVNSVALQVPTKVLRQSADEPVIGIWSTTQRKNAQGHWTQVSRLGNPDFLPYVTDPELPKLIEKIYGIKAPAAPRDDLVSVFLTGVQGLNQPPNVRPAEALRLNTAIPPAKKPKRLGVLDDDNAGFPNGRRLTDDVVDIQLQAVEGELLGNENDLGDAVNANDRSFGKSFPYLALPASGSAGPTDGDITRSATERNQLNGGAAASVRDDDTLVAGTPSAFARPLTPQPGRCEWYVGNARTGPDPPHSPVPPYSPALPRTAPPRHDDTR